MVQAVGDQLKKKKMVSAQNLVGSGPQSKRRQTHLWFGVRELAKSNVDPRKKPPDASAVTERDIGKGDGQGQ